MHVPKNKDDKENQMRYNNDYKEQTHRVKKLFPNFSRPLKGFPGDTVSAFPGMTRSSSFVFMYLLELCMFGDSFEFKTNVFV